MKKAIVIVSALLLLVQGTAMAARTGRDRIERGPMGYGEGHDCSGLVATAKLKLTAEQADRLHALDERYKREIAPLREQRRGKGRELKAEWLQAEPDRGRIKMLHGEAAKLRERLRATWAAHRGEVLNILTPEQRAYVPDSGPGRAFNKPAGWADSQNWR